MASFRRTNSKAFSKTATKLTEESIFWKKYSNPVLIKEFGPIDCIDISPVDPYYFAVTCSCRVQIYNSITNVVVKNLNRFKECAYGGTFRNDGKLLCAGGEEGVVKVFDVGTKSLLRILTGHQASVHKTFFTSSGTQIVSFSDDKSTSVWDLATEKRLITFNEHTDYIRAGAVNPISPEIYVSGGYDKIINVYDTRTNKTVFSVNHDAPIESILYLPTGGIFLSAGGTEIRVWDTLSSGKLLTKISQHHKTITCLQIGKNGKNILSGSLDRHVNVYDVGSYKKVHSFNFPNSVLSLGINNNNGAVVTGMIDGMISVMKREETDKEKQVCKKKISYRCSGENLYDSNNGTFIPESRKQIMSKHDMCLRKFQYSKALDHVMNNYIINKTPHVTTALIYELCRRQGLHQALAGRQGKPLINILKFLIKHIGNVEFARVMLDATNIFIDVYEDMINKMGPELQQMVGQLFKKLKEEIELITSLLELQGALEIILSSAEMSSSQSSNKSHDLIPSKLAEKNLIINIV